ncbi:unnamed protein product [Callosobruchus maculatus]|uniref:Uncharacterized protein n=1 Tax=Callosobruchus maculatus TaxID=64391 RepID=A0A653DAY5_CALMS|nr:unnamed protein product [Callosobruchus maculatus]
MTEKYYLSSLACIQSYQCFGCTISVSGRR